MTIRPVTEPTESDLNLITTLRRLISASARVDRALDQGELSLIGVKKLERLHSTVISQSSHLLVAPPTPAVGRSGSPEPPPDQAFSLHGNLLDLRIVPKHLIDAIPLGRANPAEVAELAGLYNDTITSLRWLVDHQGTATGQDVLRDLTTFQCKRAKR